jgi:hypothetical protein
MFAAVAALAVGAYARFLGGGFRVPDTLVLVDTAQVHRPHDVARLFGERLMAGTSFSEGSFYRPLSALTFAVDHAIWGLRPFGYNLSNVALHGLVAAATAALAWTLMRDRFATLVAGGVVALHPLGVESVPAPARRQDVLATLFVLIAVVAFARTARRGPASPGAWLSAVALALGLLSKESAILAVAPLAVLAWASGATDDRRRAARLRQVARDLLPHALLLVVVLLVRAAVVASPSIVSLSDVPGRIGEALADGSRGLLCTVIVVGSHPAIDRAVAVVAACVLAGAVAAAAHGSRRRTISTVEVATAWLGALAAVLVLSDEFAWRSLYGALPAFGLLVAVVAAGVRDRARSAPTRAFGGAVVAILVAAIVAASPLVRPYPAWRTVGEATSATLRALRSPVVAQAPAGATITFSVVPGDIGAGHRPLRPAVRSAVVFRGYALAPIVDLLYPDRHYRVRVLSVRRVPADARHVEARVSASPAGPRIAVVVR